LLRAAGSSRAAIVKVWNPASCNREPNFCITSTCGDVRTNASIAVWSVQADSVQNVLRSGWASSARPYAPSLARTWARLRIAARRKRTTSRYERSSRRDASTITG
jgi:hypothetical protein